MEQDSVKKVAYIVNAVILLLVFGLMSFFSICKVTFMVWFSIPTAAIYLVGFVLIHRNRLAWYVRMVYFWLTLYMLCSTVCLGYGYGFHLYCFSMIPIIFVTEYISFKLGKTRLNAVIISMCIAAAYLTGTGYTAYFGSVYDLDQRTSAFFWVFNALCVFGFLIYYTRYLISNVISSEKKLVEIAHMDQLTQMYNRHYMLTCLEGLPQDATACLAIADIDNFKHINDTYGHNAGDVVLKTVAQKMKQACEGCTVGRWGGEEFLILAPRLPEDTQVMLDNMRKLIAQEPVAFEEQRIPVTLTIGFTPRSRSLSIDEWVQEADKRLYIGKNNGKNQVVS